MNETPTNSQVYRCVDCGSEEVEICLPAFFRLNGTYERPESVDIEADGICYWCPACDCEVEVRAPDGEILG